MKKLAATLIFLLATLQGVFANGVGSRLAYLAQEDPYYPNGGFPRFTTPMWVGEEGVDAVIALTIDDMCRPFLQGRPKGLPVYARQPRVYLDFLQPVVDRLLAIDGRAPVSVFSLQLDEEDAVVRKMLDLGMSMECHTFTHPVPLMRAAEGDDSLALVKADFLRSVSSLQGVKGGGPVAHRTPGCDARNTASPRFYAEVFPLAPLQMDSSIFTAFTKPLPGLPKEWFVRPDGTPRFARFITGIPFTKKFVNYVDSHPYPYVINRRIWELPAIIPGDAHGVHAHGRNNDETVEDWKRALDIIVARQGVMTICFHPHGYIRSEQLVAFVDYADETYGKKIKFLNCGEILDRITKNAGLGEPLIDREGGDNGVRYLDANADGFMDVLIANSNKRVSRVWNPDERRFDDAPFPLERLDSKTHFFTADRNGSAGMAREAQGGLDAWRFEKSRWVASEMVRGVEAKGLIRFRDFNGDGVSDIVAGREVWLSVRGGEWARTSFQLPRPLAKSLRFVDIDRDGDDDLIHSDETDYAIWLFDDVRKGWSTKLLSGEASDDGPVPPLTIQGRNNGVWFRDGEMIVVNELTANPKADHLWVRRFEDWLKAR